MNGRWHLGALVDRVRTSLFVVPIAYVVAGVVLGQVGVMVDQALSLEGGDLPLGMTSTVESARSVLTTVAGATMTVAGIAFSISLLILQLASSQYSPRVVHGLFRDPLNKQVMGIVLGTFTYCLVVLRAVHAPVEEGGEAVIPTISVSVGVVLGLVAVTAIVAFINHNAHATDVSNLLGVSTRQAIEQVRTTWPDRGDVPDVAADELARWCMPVGSTLHVDADLSGWIQRADVAAMLDALPPDTTFRCDYSLGDYALGGLRLGEVWPVRGDGAGELAARLRDATAIGRSRTIQDDPAYGLRQLVDVALRALSSGINDPTTAEDAILHIGEVLAAMLVRDPPPRLVRGDDGRTVVLPSRPDHDAVIRLAFDELRRDAASRPRICVTLLETIRRLTSVVEPGSPAERSLSSSARLILAGFDEHHHLPDDRRQVERAYERFTSTVSRASTDGDQQRIRAAAPTTGAVD